MKIPVGSDHAGFAGKEVVKSVLENLGHEPVDLGTYSDDRVDYPEFAAAVARSVNSGEYDKGILVCGSGQGVCMTANKFENIRAALVYDNDSAALSRQHNDANIMCLPGRKLSEEELGETVKIWLDTAFEGGRHAARVAKIASETR